MRLLLTVDQRYDLAADAPGQLIPGGDHLRQVGVIHIPYTDWLLRCVRDVFLLCVEVQQVGSGDRRKRLVV